MSWPPKAQVVIVVVVEGLKGPALLDADGEGDGYSGICDFLLPDLICFLFYQQSEAKDGVMSKNCKKNNQCYLFFKVYIHRVKFDFYLHFIS